ncbi:MAG TPA: hypothetical protein VH309_13885 [Elusimicrobiota bacterium]|jgi:hypothetical protein|nr:hypothetical protein [Elusimicrobiota bacterium]
MHIRLAAMLILLLAALAPAAVAADAPQREADIGVVVGEPLGFTGKIWFDDWFAADFGAGIDEGNAGFWADALWHNWTLLPQPQAGRLAAYVGVGPQLRAGGDARFGIRAIVGAAFRPTAYPVELYAEAGPLFEFTQGGWLDAAGGVGVRYRFDAAPLK